MKLVVAGSRTLYPHQFQMYDWLKHFHIDIDDVEEFVNGGCPTGIDKYCNDWFTSTIFEADWDTHGKAAGPIRNRQMAEYGDALLLIWDGESRGSKNMRQEMLALDKPVYEVIMRTVK
jgi:hypothetical protein